MGKRRSLDDKFCPECGAPLQSAEAIALEDDLTTQGVYEREGSHLLIDGGEIRIYEHDAGQHQEVPA